MDPSTMLGPIDALEPYIEYVILALVLVNMLARAREHSVHVRQAESGGADAISRDPIREGTNLLLVLSAFYYMTVHAHGGMVMSVLVLGVVLSDLFEFEARKVEARKEEALSRPNGAIVASFIALLYASFQALFFLVKDYWGIIF